MKYCEICAGANEDNALECKYCHAKFSISKESSETELPVTFEPQNTFSGTPSCDSISEVCVENTGVSNYISTLSTGMFVFWCIYFTSCPIMLKVLPSRMMNICPLRIILIALLSISALSKPVGLDAADLRSKHICDMRVPVPAERWIVNDFAFAGAASETSCLFLLSMVA